MEVLQYEREISIKTIKSAELDEEIKKRQLQALQYGSAIQQEQLKYQKMLVETTAKNLNATMQLLQIATNLRQQMQ
ncbi:hypothetical protein E2C01_046597 [Portunus trituberculatus]|uniref:Uncharacterized protein n=1 Tax=Portunus trituberculatus TaxID=210409 RepID=A0A5B7FZ01_PORTR|nr:hypothetical protein [Portunus trituberculatus]